MNKIFVLFLFVYNVTCLPPQFTNQRFFVGIEYEKSLPMEGGSDRLRHVNNYDPFYVTVTTTARDGFVLDYLEVTATTDVTGEVQFCLIQGQVGSRTMVFQISSNQSDFLSYTYKSYGIRDEEYIKWRNIIIIYFNKAENIFMTSSTKLIFDIIGVFFVCNLIL